RRGRTCPCARAGRRKAAPWRRCRPRARARRTRSGAAASARCASGTRRGAPSTTAGARAARAPPRRGTTSPDRSCLAALQDERVARRIHFEFQGKQRARRRGERRRERRLDALGAARGEGNSLQAERFLDHVAMISAMRRQVITAAGAPSPMAHYSQGILAGETLYAAGQIASDYKTGVAPEARQDPAFPYYGSEIQKQARYVLENLRAVYREAGLELADTVKAQVFLTD